MGRAFRGGASAAGARRAGATAGHWRGRRARAFLEGNVGAFPDTSLPHLMIILVNPRATRPQNRRFPLSLMALGGSLPADVSWTIVDGNRPGLDPFREISALVDARAGGPDPVRLLAISVMPGPQLVAAVP